MLRVGSRELGYLLAPFVPVTFTQYPSGSRLPTPLLYRIVLGGRGCSTSRILTNLPMVTIVRSGERRRPECVCAVARAIYATLLVYRRQVGGLGRRNEVGLFIKTFANGGIAGACDQRGMQLRLPGP